MQALVMLGGLIVAAIGQKLNSNPNVPTAVVKLSLTAIGALMYLLVARPAGWPGSPEFLQWFDDAVLWALALPGAASLIGLAPNMATSVVRTVVAIVAVIGMVTFPATTSAQTKYSIWDVGKRAQVSVNVGALFFFEEETGAESSKGVTGGGALTYNLHERFSVVGLYDHSFPIDASGAHEDVVGGTANLTVYPPKPGESQTKLAIGGGVVGFSPGAVDSWSGYEGHITIARVFRDGWSLAAKYQHVVPFEDGRVKVNMGKIALNHRLFGAK